MELKRLNLHPEIVWGLRQDSGYRNFREMVLQVPAFLQVGCQPQLLLLVHTQGKGRGRLPQPLNKTKVMCWSPRPELRELIKVSREQDYSNWFSCCCCCCCCWVASVVSDSGRPHRQHLTRLPHPWDSPGKNTGVGCHFLLQCMKVKSESEVAQSFRLLATPWTATYQAPLSMDFSRQEYWSGVPLPSPNWFS